MITVSMTLSDPDKRVSRSQRFSKSNMSKKVQDRSTVIIEHE